MLGVPTSEIEVSFASNKGFWLLLDIDLSVASIRNPSVFPLRFKA